MTAQVVDGNVDYEEESDREPPARSGFVAVIGRPNVGKSTLLNRLLGQKIAITSDKPQTTRDRILGVLTDEDAQLIFLDTPGIHRPRNRLGRHMVNVAEQAIAGDADVLLWLVDVNAPPTAEDRLISERLDEMRQSLALPFTVVGANKVDAWQGNDLAARAAEFKALLPWLPAPGAGQDELPVLPFSAASGQGVDRLVRYLKELAPPGPLYYPQDQVTDLSMRFIASEIVREKALLLLRQEVPHSLAVVVTEWNERRQGTTHVAATIYVERHTHKGIVLGSGGYMIKRIGQAARPEIEEMVGAKVYLELWVKVLQKWRRKPNLLRRLGYEL